MPRGVYNRKARAEGASVTDVDVMHGDFAKLIEVFKRDHPQEWEACRTWPTESGIAHIAETLKD